MDSAVTTRRMLYWLLFAAIAAFVIFIRILPIDLSAGRWPAPDWILALGYVWVLRRPNFIPVFVFATIMFFNDMLLMNAPGLWSALSVIGFEFLRGRSKFSRELPFLVEWAMVAGVILAVTIANRLILSIFVVSQPDASLTAVLFVGTIAIYPAMVILSASVLGVRKVALGAVDQLGHRI